MDPLGPERPAVSHFVQRDTCPGCTSARRTELFACKLLDEPIRSHLVEQYRTVGTIELDWLEGGVFRLMECGECGLLYHAEVPDDALMARVYDHWIDPVRAQATQRAQRDMDSRLRFARELMLADRRLRHGDTPLSVLDYGMGWGAWCTMARAFGCDVHGHESSPLRIEHARSLGIPVLTWDELPKHSFDFINSEQVFEHLTDPLGALKHLVRALAPGGLIKISVPDGRDVKRRLAVGDWSAMDGPHSLLVVTPLQHVNGFHREALLEMAHRAGLCPAALTLGDYWASNADRIGPGHLLGALTRPLGRRFFASDTYVFFERESVTIT